MSYAEFDAIQIGIASPEQIREWSYGEVKRPETINYRTLKPEKDGLFCEKIFGPTKDWECNCGKYKKIRYKGKVCDRCGVEITKAKVRRERMGHIELAAPVSHIWYFKGIPSRMGLLLDISPRILEKVLYFAAYIVIDPGFSPLSKNQILSEKEYRDMREKYEDDFDAGMGAEAVKKLLQQIDLEELSAQLRAELKDASGQKKARIVKRLEVVDAFRVSGNKPEWMIIDVLPAQRTGHHRAQREADAPGGCGRPHRQRPPGPGRHRRQQPGPQIPVRHAQGQAGPVPPEPFGQAGGLLRPFRHRGRPGAEALPVWPAQGDGH